MTVGRRKQDGETDRGGRSLGWWALAITSWLIAIGCAGEPTPGPVEFPDEDAYRANNRGVALLEQFDYAGAAAAFSEALALDPSLGMARLNLALALFHDQDLEGANREATEARRLLPTALEPPYLLGLVARADNRPDDAAEAFSTVLESDPGDVGANINLGQIHLEAQDYDAAIEHLRVAYEREPFNITAVYNLGLALARSGNAEEGRELLEQAQRLRPTLYATTYGPGYLNEGRYAEAMASTGAEAALVDPTPPSTSFTARPLPSVATGTPPVSPFGRVFSAGELSVDGARALADALGGGVTPIDVDVDGDLDLFFASPEGQQLLRNDGDRWTDMTAVAGLVDAPSVRVPLGAVAGDYDNDHLPDLFVLRYGESTLYRNEGDGRFEDVTRQAGIEPYPHLPGAAAFGDVDHDGDIDLVIAGLADVVATRESLGGDGAVFPDDFAPAPIQLWRNNGDGTFTDITEAAGLDSVGHAVAIVPTDFDNRRDLDLLVVEHDRTPRLFMNTRDRAFRDVASDVGLADLGLVARSLSAGDVNKDGFPDFVFSGEDGATVALSDGRGRFSLAEAPEVATGASALQLVDYDADGLLDLLAWTPEGPRLARNLGDRWIDTSEAALGALTTLPTLGTGHGLAVADLDLDGDSDLVAGGPGPVTIAENQAAPGRTSARVSLRGLVTNRLGIGAKIQVRAGGLRSRHEVSSATPAAAPADVVFGLGPRPGADVVRVLWPSGILQAEVPATSPFLPPTLDIQELDREPSSCPLLFTWNGTRFEFVTDFLGGGEMGYWQGPGLYNTPDPVEYIRIRGDQLVPRDGIIELRVTNELEEAVFFDQLELTSVTHPETMEVHPNEGMTPVPKPHRLHGVSEPRVPSWALDDDGTDVTDLIAEQDRTYPEGFALTAIRRYAAPHTLTLDLGRVDGPSVLLLTGWTDYAFSSDNVAAFQAGIPPVLPTLEIKDTFGRWRPGVEIGIPVGRPQTIALDLSAVLRPGERVVRIVTNLRIYWDQIRIGSRVSLAELDEERLPRTRAVLRQRGFSAELHPEGTEPTIYDYDRVTPTSPWKTLAGHYTREGDVGSLLAETDDMFAISRDGDEIALSFDATGLDPLAPGWTRTYLLRADGFSKEMDVNSASPDTVEPLPFHAMSGYPYGETEHYPDTPEHQSYRDTYNTRTVIASVPSLDRPGDDTP